MEGRVQVATGAEQHRRPQQKGGVGALTEFFSHRFFSTMGIRKKIT